MEKDKRTIIRERFGKRLMELLGKRGISQHTLAKNCDIERSALSKYIAGERTPRMDTFLDICDFLKVSPNYFLDAPKRDYEADDPKSDAAKTIESVFFLMNHGVIVDGGGLEMARPTGLSDGPDGVVIQYFINGCGIKTMREVLRESARYKGSSLVKDERISEKLVEKYEKSMAGELGGNEEP